METIRKYGKPPFTAAVIHGGPGAPGEMAPVARQLSRSINVLEPLQNENSLDGQVNELKQLLEENGELPITLIGHSWGAWLSFILAARYPLMVKKLILVGSGPFEEKYALRIMKTRLDRLDKQERLRLHNFTDSLNSPDETKRNNAFAGLGKLISGADTFHSQPYRNEIIQFHYSQHLKVWNDASEMRRSGELLKMGKNIECPTIAIHGDYDPHPFEGVKTPLSLTIKKFTFMLLKNCGHIPWIETEASDKFYKILMEELATAQ